MTLENIIKNYIDSNTKHFIFYNKCAVELYNLFMRTLYVVHLLIMKHKKYIFFYTKHIPKRTLNEQQSDRVQNLN